MLKGHVHAKKEKAGNNVCGATQKEKSPNNKKINLLGTFSNPTASYLYREHVTGCFG